ncbi:hypothetical protein [Cereibacter sphaeroides]|uniref:hypothetical protein n=1 Tax=Cereibacter sphaeroides TaxID=1063 RepID=UPI001F20732C|nr:hypothetical protein [Cereibacter sphaeroides]MCE6967423.1 hypothetical protein [Cereibacter sphaeroides]
MTQVHFLTISMMLLVGGPASAQFADPVRSHLDTGSDNSVMYVTDRCAGLFIAMSPLSEKQPALADMALKNATALMSASTRMQMERGKAIEDARSTATRSIGMMSDEYVQVFSQSWIRTANYFTDPVLLDDLKACVSFAEMTREGL